MFDRYCKANSPDISNSRRSEFVFMADCGVAEFMACHVRDSGACPPMASHERHIWIAKKNVASPATD